MENRGVGVNLKILRQLLLAGDDLIHVSVALTLMGCAATIIIRTLPNFLHPDTLSLLQVVNDILLALIVMELMWPVVRFLKRKPFSLNPFIYIGIISSTRRLLMIEAEHSAMARLGSHVGSWSEIWPMLSELGINVVIILILAIALRLLSPLGMGNTEI